MIPQVDGAWEEDSIMLPSVEDLSEGEEQSLSAMLCMLRQWLRESTEAASTAPVPKPWDVLARLEVSMKILGLVLEPPMCTCLTAVSQTTLEPTGAPLQEPFSIDGPDVGELHFRGVAGGDLGHSNHAAALREDEDESGENAVVVEESGAPLGDSSNGIAGPIQAMAAAAARPVRVP